MARFDSRNRLSHTAIWGERLAEFLNAPPASDQHVRIFKVFEHSQELDRLPPDSREAGSLRHMINALLSDFRVIPVLSPDGWGWRPAPATKAGAVALATSSDVPELTPAFALGLIAQMTSGRTLGRIRQCLVCRKWFFAQSDKKQVCSSTCRFRKHKQEHEETFKEERAEYMRKYRDDSKKRRKGNAKTKR